MHVRVLVLVGVAFLTAAASPSREFDVDVFQSGSYSILFRLNWIETDAWINSGPVLVKNNNKTYTSDDGTLKLDSFKETSTEEKGPFGNFRRYTWQWVSEDDTTRLVTEIDKYYEIALVVFRQVLGSTLTNTGGSPSGLASSFPSFWFSDSQKKRGWMTYSGNSTPHMHACMLVCEMACVCTSRHACMLYGVLLCSSVIIFQILTSTPYRCTFVHTHIRTCTRLYIQTFETVLISVAAPYIARLNPDITVTRFWGLPLV